MLDVEKTVFISYCRSFSPFLGLLIFKNLRDCGYDVFMDVERVGSGQSDTIILNQIAARAHFLVVLTLGAVDCCAAPDDWLRREIEYAMDLQRNIVPVVGNNFSFAGTEKFLTGKLAELSRYNGLILPPPYNFGTALERLHTDFLKLPVSVEIRPTPPADQPVVQGKIEKAARAQVSLMAEWYFSQGDLCYHCGDDQGAIENYTEAIRLNPNYASAYHNRAFARQSQGDLPGALADFSEAIRLNPQSAVTYEFRGLARQSQGDLPGALADFSEAIRLSAQDARTYIMRSNVRRIQGDLSGAIADANEALRLDPPAAKTCRNQGIARAAQGDLPGAIENYTEAIRLNPKYAEAYLDRGTAYEKQEEYQKALADYDAVLRINPHHMLAKKYRTDVLKIMMK